MAHTLLKPSLNSFSPYRPLALPLAPSLTSFVTASPSSSPSPVPRPPTSMSPPSPIGGNNHNLSTPSTIPNDPTPLPPSRVLSLTNPSIGYQTSVDAPACVKPSMSVASPSLEPLQFSEAPGYIHILPRTVSPSAQYKKRCETCGTEHDGSFGAGRFCSSRCARTVGGLAHRKKRMQERDARQRLCSITASAIAIHPVHTIAKSRLPHRHSGGVSIDSGHISYQGFRSHEMSHGVPYVESYGHGRSRRTAMSINSLLNPS